MAEQTYLCDPEKNKECKHSSCYKFGGPCYLTTYKEYAKDLEGENKEPEEKPKRSRKKKKNDAE